MGDAFSVPFILSCTVSKITVGLATEILSWPKNKVAAPASRTSRAPPLYPHMHLRELIGTAEVNSCVNKIFKVTERAC